MQRRLLKSASFIIILLVLIISPATPDESSVSAQTTVEKYIPFFTYERLPYYEYGLDGGTIEGIVIDPNDSDILYAGSWGNGIYKSTDGGETWVSKNNGLESPYVYEIAIDPSDSQHILVSAYEHGINQSFDGGESWAAVGGKIPEGSVVYSIDFRPDDPSIVYAALREPTIYVGGAADYPGGVYRSTNGGTNWKDRSEGLKEDYVYDLGIDPNDPDIMYTAMHDTGVYKTTDGGANWVKKNDGLVDLDIRSIEITPDSRVYIGYWDGYGFGYSDDGGDNWLNVTSTSDLDLYVYEVLIDPNKTDSVYLSTYTGLYRCDNPRYDSQCEQIAHDDILVFDLAIDEKSGVDPDSGLTKRLYTGLQHCAVLKSEDAGETFDPIYEGIRANIINSLIINPYYPAVQYVSVYGRGIFKSEDNGTTWTPLRSLPIGRFINELAFRPGRYNVIYAVGDRGGVFWSTDAGNSWNVGNTNTNSSQQVTAEDYSQSNEIDSSLVYSWMDPIDQQEFLRAVDPDEVAVSSTTPDFTTLSFSPYPDELNRMIAGTRRNGVKLTDNYGQFWAGALSTSRTIYDSMTDISQAPYVYYIGIQDNGVMRSRNDQHSWEHINNGMSGIDVFSLELADAGVYYAGTEEGIYKTENGGEEWVLVGLAGTRVNDVLVDSTLATTVYAATSQGLYQSVNDGVNWQKIALPELFNQNIIMLVQIPGSTDLYIGTDGGDMIRWTN